MTQRSRRIQITLGDDSRAIFQRLAKAQKRPLATLVAEFLDETAPALQNVVDVVEKATNAISRVGKEERERFAVAEAELLQHHHAAVSAMTGAQGVVDQLVLDLGRKDSAPREVVSEARLRSAVRRPDPPPSNRGVNMTGKSKNGTLRSGK